MLDSQSVITTATDGIIKELAFAYDCSLTRMYERLGNQSNYPKTKKLIRKIGAIDKERVRIIKADLDAMFYQILGEGDCTVDVAEFHRETSEAIQSVLEGKPRNQQIKDFRDVAATSYKAIGALEMEGK